MPDDNHVSLKKHLEALRKADKDHLEARRIDDQRAVALVSEWVKERLETHNGILKEWRDTTERDREGYARKEELKALSDKFDAYRDFTAKALALAEGKSKGIDAVRVAVSFIAGLALSGIGVYATVRGLH